MTKKKRTWPLVDALRLHHETPNGQQSIDSWTEKLLVEICAGHEEGKTYRELSDGLGVGLQEVKAVIRVNKKLEN
jgi:hypothetical protein